MVCGECPEFVSLNMVCLYLTWSMDTLIILFSVLGVAQSGDGEEVVFVASYSAREKKPPPSTDPKTHGDAKFIALICLNAVNFEVSSSFDWSHRPSSSTHPPRNLKLKVMSL
jgi:hypothetical protein